jgi:lipopolysaccharide export LptBFGC system permease protein LptF
MVFTLHRYILRELLKVFILSALAMSMILSLGGILRPIQDYGVGPQQVLHLIGYFLPITLTFVLPMAGLFAAALVYGRLANDNELDACRASGISLLTAVYPGLVLAIIIAIATLVLSFYVVPTYVQRAERSIKADAKQILYRNLQRKGHYKLPDGRFRIYADAANPQKDELLGVVVVDVKDNDIKKLITTERASVHFEPHKKFNEVMITVIAHNAYQLDSEGEAFSEWLPVSGRFSSLLADDVKFKKINEMKEISHEPMQFYPIAKQAYATYAQLTCELLAQDISTKIADEQDRFYKLQNEDKLINFTATQCTVEGESRIELSGEVTLLEYSALTGQLMCSWHSDRAILELDSHEPNSKLTMIIYNTHWQQNDGPSGLAQRHIIRGLQLPSSIPDKISPDVLRAIDSTSSVLTQPSKVLESMQKILRRKIAFTLVEIRAEIHSRLVLGIGCITLILIGIALGIIFKGGHLLTAFGVSSVSAAALVVCIMAGKNLTKNPGAQSLSGIILMWGGLVALSVLAVGIYHKLLKT